MKKAFHKLGEMAGRNRNRAIDKALRKDRVTLAKEIHILLLGSGESGKSTIFKQLRIIHDDPFKQDERETYRHVVFGNILTNINSLIKASFQLNIPIENEENRESAKILTELGEDGKIPDTAFTTELATKIKHLWEDAGIQKVYERRSELQLYDSAAYFFEHVERVAEEQYMPTDEDILRARLKTTGVTTTTFSFGGFEFKLFDVGGQRNERRKWINFFENVRALIFVVSLSEFDLLCYEDGKTNRMVESMNLFEEIVNSSYFSSTPVILFFNKTDLFREKIQQADLSSLFEDYKGGHDYDKAVEFIKQKYLSLNKSNVHEVYVHQTCATDTENVREVFDNLKEAILSGNLHS